MSELNLPSISLFTGAMGLDLGLERAGFHPKVAVECNPDAVKTISKNKPNLPLIKDFIENTDTEIILEKACLRVGEATLVTGGPSCKPFSNAGSRQSIAHDHGNLYLQFIRVVREAQPRFFIMENVRGILSAAIRHRPLKERGPGYPPLCSDEELGSAFLQILNEFQKLGYHIIFDLLNAADYGAPQSRERLIFIGSRDGEPLAMPLPTHSKDSANGLPAWMTLDEGLRMLKAEELRFKEFSEKTKGYLRQLKAGQNWRDLPDEIKSEAIGKAYDSWGGRSGFLRRLSWNRPAPTLTTDPNGRATMLCHPDEVRPLSVEEYACIQQFPLSWQVEGSRTQQYIQLGNAVPLNLGAAIGQAIVTAMACQPSPELVGKIVCPNKSLLLRQSKLPRTQLNPPRMRIENAQDVKSARIWLKGVNRHRREVLEFCTQQQVLEFVD